MVMTWTLALFFAATASLAVLGTLHRAKYPVRTALCSAAMGIAALAAVNLLAGYTGVTVSLKMCIRDRVFTPLFLGQSVGDVVAMLIPAIIPFNFLYAAINSAVTFVVYKPISAFLHKNA